MKWFRRGVATPLFLRIFVMMLACVAVVQIANVALLFAVDPPPTKIYTVGQVADALRTATDASGEFGVMRTSRVASEPWNPRAERLQVSLAVVLDIPADRIQFGFQVPFLQRPPVYSRNGVPPATAPRREIARDLIIVGDFKASLRQPDGSWVTVESRSTALELWRQSAILWLLLAVAAVAPFAWALARRIAKPIGAFAAAAERLGRDPRAPPLAIDGPSEIGDAAVAFNQMQARLNRYVDDRSTLIAAIAHDLRTPLMRLELRLENASEKVRRACQGDIRDMEAMIAATLAFVRDTTQPQGRRPLDLRSLAESVTDDMADCGDDVTLAPGDALVLDGNSAALKSMLSNLIVNAVKYAGSAKVSLGREGENAVVEVQDNGPGIPTEDIDRVFEPFFRGERSRNRDTGGIGLGLASVRAVARAHGGDVAVTNRPGGGLSARVTLPV